MNAAEELFAQHGIAAVSNRKIAEHAGTANHSAVAYHFGTRDELFRALVLRHFEVMSVRRDQLFAELGPEPTTHDIVRCRLMPLIEQLDSLPKPSWRAQFLMQAHSKPDASPIIKEALLRDEETLQTLSMKMPVSNISESVMRARSGLIANLVLGVCAQYEAEVNTGIERGSWTSVGYFLIDAAAGMLSAPVTHAGGVPRAAPTYI
ncbi:AcrR family transcriptional regulator [Leucobacter exalbidus]|uniref:AcrR family transcriptional regulator n=2 Tax=Leucobacter exalbidus TaxID=662960 RepID=A0A940PVA4_9MICO|nr:AcrR family transcriptional regulator [Leucobacter exalbidus]